MAFALSPSPLRQHCWLSFGLLACLQTVAVWALDEVLLEIDNTAFTRSQFEEIKITFFPRDVQALRYAKFKQMRNPSPQLKLNYLQMDESLERKAVRTLVSQRLMLAEIPTQIKTFNRKQMVEDWHRRVVQRFGSLQGYRQKSGRTPIQVEQEIQSYIEQELRRYVIHHVIQPASGVTEMEMKAYYERNKDEYRVKGAYRLRILKVDKYRHPDANIQKIADEYRNLYVQQGFAFDELAQKYSDDESAVRGGLLRYEGDEWITPEQLELINIDWARAVVKLKTDKTAKSRADQVSPPLLATADGKTIAVVLVFKDAARPEHLVPYDKVDRRLLQLQAQRAKNEAKVETWTRDKLAKARIQYKGRIVNHQMFFGEDNTP